MTFADDIQDEAGSESIEFAVIGDMGWSGFHADCRHAPGLARKGVVLPWFEARPLLDYDYDTGYGAPDCQAVYAWTATRVIYVSQYDGSTALRSVPRNPTDGPVEMPGE